jgi:hypothetical protein
MSLMPVILPVVRSQPQIGVKQRGETMSTQMPQARTGLLPMSSLQTAHTLELGREKECPFVSSRLLLLLKGLFVVSTLGLGAQVQEIYDRIKG